MEFYRGATMTKSRRPLPLLQYRRRFTSTPSGVAIFEEQQSEDSLLPSVHLPQA